MKKTIKSVILLFIVLFSTFSQAVYANQGFDATFFNLSNINYYDRDNCDTSSGGSNNSNSSNITLEGNDNVEKVWNYLKDRGLSDEQVAGIIGGMWGETGGSFDPGTLEQGNNIGYGIAQWSYERRTNLENYAKEKGKPSNDLGLQLDFLWKELEERGELAQIKSTNDIRQVSDIWVNQFERPLESLRAGRIEEGVTIGNQLMDRYGGKRASGNTQTSSATSSGDITFIGDSITKGANLSSHFSGSNVSAENGDSIRAAINRLPSDIKKTVVINLGANDNFSESDAEELISKIGSDKKVYMINSYSKNANADFELINSRINSFASKHGNITVLDWKSYVDSHGGKEKLYQADGVHPNAEGYEAYLKFLEESLDGKNSTNNSNSSSSSCSENGGGGTGETGGNWGTSDEASRITEDGFPIFFQCDPRWANENGFDGTICNTACGPSALISIIIAMTGKKVSYREIIEKARAYTLAGGGTTLDVVNIVNDYGLRRETIPADVARINEVLDKGGMVMIAGTAGGPLPFLDAGSHWVAIRKRTASGKWLVANSGINEGHDMEEYDPSYIVSKSLVGTVEAVLK